MLERMRSVMMSMRAFKKLDLGDFVGIRGKLFRTKTGEVTVRAKEYRLVSKALRPLPEKWHGLTDNEQIYRQRYLDLIVNEDSRERFRTRSQIIREIREFFLGSGFFGSGNPHVTGSFWRCSSPPISELISMRWIAILICELHWSSI